MKKIYTLALALVLFIPATYSQKGLSLGLNGAFISSTIINQNTWGNGHEYDYKPTFSGSFGFDIGYNFTDHIGIYSGYWFTNLGQNYDDQYEHVPWERDIQLKYHMVPVMLKFTGSQSRVNFIGGIGVLFAMLKEANQTWTRDGEDWNNEGNLGAKDVTSRFESSDIILNLELGARIIIIDNLYLDASLNFGYGLKDINVKEWQIPDSDGEYKASNNAYGGIKLGIAYVLFGK